MATKVQTAQAYDTSAPDLTDLVLQIEGLSANHDGTFTLRDIPRIDIEYGKIDEVLRNAGVSNMDAAMLTEDFATRVFEHQLAKCIAQRTKRVG